MALNSDQFTIKYIRYEDNKYNKQILDLYLSNFLTTAKISGYQFLTCPYQKHGIKAFSLTILALFAVFWLLTSPFLGFITTLFSFIIFIHFICFVIGPKLMELEALKWLRQSFIEGIYPKMVDYYTVQGNRLYLAIREDTDEVIGMTSYEEKVHFQIPECDPKNGVQLTRVSVNDKYKSRGIATKLQLLVEQEAKQDGKKYISLITLNTNKAALGLYQKNGFGKIKMVDPHESFLMHTLGIDRVFMLKWI